MRDSRSRYVVDANIFIDFHRGQLLGALFALPFAFLAPDVIVAELKAPDGQQLLGYGLRSVSLDGDAVAAVAALAQRHRAPSINDLFALILARIEKATLLTGDGAVRRLAESEGIAVHGTLWVLDELVRREIVMPKQAVRGLERMLAAGSRLPAAECQRRMQRWGRE